VTARAWLDALPAGSLRVQLVPLVVSSLASEHPEEAIALAGELPGYDGDLDMLAAFGGMRAMRSRGKFANTLTHRFSANGRWRGLAVAKEQRIGINRETRRVG